MKKSKGSFLITAGLLLIAAALFLACWNLREAKNAGEAAVEVVEQLVEATPVVTVPESTATTAPEVVQPEVPLYEQYPEMEMPSAEIDGEYYIGVLTIPALGLELPVMDKWSYPRLKVSPCRYVGSAYQGDLVIMAHNYDRHFGRLKDLEQGDGIVFTDMDGNVFRYQVAGTELLQPTDIENMTAGEWPLTLFSCTVGGSARITVRCETAAS